MGNTKKCEHGRRRSLCKDCGGASICDHGRQRHRCKDCGGTSICEHRRRREICKECGGSCICEHGRERGKCSRCKPELTFKQCKYEATKKGIPFDLTYEEYKSVVDSHCFYCGESEAPMSVDQVNPGKGYTFYNVQPLCDSHNRMKLDWPEEEFEQQIIKIFQHQPALAERAGFVLKEKQQCAT